MYKNINHTIEHSIVNYLSTSFTTPGNFLNQLNLSGSLVQFYTSLNPIDKSEASTVVVYCRSANEIAYNTRVYDMTVDVTCGEIAYDIATTGSTQLGQLPMYIFNEFVSSSVARGNFTDNNISVYQVQIQGFDQDVNEDAIQSKGTFRIIGGLI